MTDAKNPDDIPNGAGDEETTSDAPDTSSGGDPDAEPTPVTENPDGTPVDNPSGEWRPIGSVQSTSAPGMSSAAFRIGTASAV